MFSSAHAPTHRNLTAPSVPPSASPQSRRELANPIRDLFDAAVRHYTIKLTCTRCRHQRIFDPHALWYHFHKRGRPDWLPDVREKCRCTSCGARRPTLDLVREPPTDETLPMPSETVWKKELRRRR
jgi:hypothetical protein